MDFLNRQATLSSCAFCKPAPAPFIATTADQLGRAINSAAACA
jgi:hypothetical protein